MSQKQKQTLDLRAGQNLVMTPQMQQAVKLLQLSNIELQDYLEDEVAQNPLLEKLDPESNDQFSEETPESTLKSDQDIDQNDFDGGSNMANIGSGGHLNMDDPDMAFENRLAQTINLRDHLLQQLAMATSEPLDKTLGSLLIDRLDENGYLRDDITDLVAQFGINQDRLQKVLNILRGFDPAGIFARDLPDCLRLQLQDQGKLDPLMDQFLNHLNLLGQHNYDELAKICDVPASVIRELADELKLLNPKPAKLFDHHVTQTAVPDVLMKTLPKDQGGGYRVEMNHETLPRVLINQEYYTEVLNATKDKKGKEYIATQLNNASWIVKALDQRAQTILKVAADIVETQDAFFLYGIEFLKPMTLKEVADRIAMHESTVSRVTTGKFMGTPRGLFELKFFFTSSIENDDGTSTSSESVKNRIKLLIDAESPKDILSDDDLAELLQKEGIDIARRTVAKYREALNIPSSVQRRRIKKLNI
jgi:RNA polymerase sigma-54 factor